jgi:hypothetical protein
MAQADSKNTIAAPVDQTRRRFLSTAAAVIAAGGTALALASLPASAADDPVFALIEAHRAAAGAFGAVLHEEDDHFNDVVAAARVDAAEDVELSALDDLMEAVPTTVPGVVALMRYIVEASSLERLGDEDINPLLTGLAAALEGLAVTS